MGKPVFSVCFLALLAALYTPAHSEDILDKLPSLGSESTIISYQHEQAIGRAWLHSFRRQAPVSEDPIVINYVEYLVYHLKAFAEMDKYQLEVVVVDTPTINAFAVPGGVIGINTGILLHTHQEDQLASIIAHELAHISQRHFARSNSESNVPAIAGLLAGIVAIAAGAGDAGMAAIMASQAASLENRLAYSRQYEREADRTGLKLMSSAGYEPQEAANMFKVMLDQSRLNRGNQYSYFSTHPIAESRVADMRARAQRLKAADIEKPSSDFDFIKAMVEVNSFDHARAAVDYFAKQPTSTIQQYGLAHAYLRDRQPAQALPLFTKLYEQDPERILLGVSKARALRQLNQAGTAKQLLVQLRQYYPDSYPVQYELAMALEAQREYAAAKAVLQRLSFRRPTDPQVWYHLAEVAGLAGDISQVHLARAEYFRYTGAYQTAERQLEILLEDEKASNATLARAEQMLAQVKRWQEQLKEGS